MERDKYTLILECSLIIVLIVLVGAVFLMTSQMKGVELNNEQELVPIIRFNKRILGT